MTWNVPTPGCNATRTPAKPTIVPSQRHRVTRSPRKMGDSRATNSGEVNTKATAKANESPLVSPFR